MSNISPQLDDVLAFNEHLLAIAEVGIPIGLEEHCSSKSRTTRLAEVNHIIAVQLARGKSLEEVLQSENLLPDQYRFSMEHWLFRERSPEAFRNLNAIATGDARVSNTTGRAWLAATILLALTFVGFEPVDLSKVPLRQSDSSGFAVSQKRSRAGRRRRTDHVGRIVGRTTMKRRNGTTLVELAISMSAGSAILFLAIALVHQTMTIERQSRDRADHSRTRSRLATRFRNDVHEAIEAQQTATESETEGTVVRLTLTNDDGSSIVYSSGEHKVTRTLVAASHEANLQESYFLGRDETAVVRTPSTSLENQ